jgi:hypothetical protein
MRKSIVIIVLAMLATSSFAFLPNITSADTSVQRIWVRVNGVITEWGTTPVFGWLGANARIADVNGTIREWAGVHATWSSNRPRMNCTVRPKENFTLCAYSANLVNTTMVRLNYSGYDLYISGLWNVVNITTAVYVTDTGELINWTRTIEPLLTNVTGELRIFPLGPVHWRQFELDIAGIDLLKGIVLIHAISFAEIKLCDVTGDQKVDIQDLVRVAKRYRTVPGMLNYDHESDLNFDDKIDIGDLTTIAANIEG